MTKALRPWISWVKSLKDQPSSESIRKLIANENNASGFSAIVQLFERDYWRRLWIVQEVHNGNEITIHCGKQKISWLDCKLAAKAFRDHKEDLRALDLHSDGIRTQDQYSLSQALRYEGPNSIPDDKITEDFGKNPEKLENLTLLQIMRICRRKLCADARDNVFGILGILPEKRREEIRRVVPVD